MMQLVQYRTWTWSLETLITEVGCDLSDNWYVFLIQFAN
jgi:hypothetical protein